MADSNTATSPGANNDASSWLKQRSAIFSNSSSTTNTINTPVKSPVKVVDKELARLKNMGAVNSVWSNKFVQEDNPGGTDKKRTSPTSRTSSPLPSSLQTPLSPRRDKVNTSPRPNANYIPVTGARQNFSTPTGQPTSPKSPKSPSFSDSKFNIRARTLSVNNKKMADDVSAALQSNKKSPEIKPAHNKQSSFSNSMGYFSKASMSSLDLNEAAQTEESSFRSGRASNASSLMSPTTSVGNGRGSVNSVPSAHEEEAANLWFQCETLKTQFAQTYARLDRANEDLEFYKRQMEQQGEVHRTSEGNSSGSVNSVSSAHEEEAANLWFQCETLKTQFAQTNARLTRANEDLEFYKRQMEQQGEVLRTSEGNGSGSVNSVSSAHEEEAANLWFQCETLKTQFAQTNARLTRANEDLEFYKRQMEQQGEVLRTSERNSNGSVNSVSSAHEEEAANLWFQCETLKTQFAQTNARLIRANEDLEFYKRQMEQQGEVHREGMATVVEEKEKETLRVRQLAELIVKQDQLLNEYEIQLECLTRLTNESAYLGQTQAEMEGLHQELGFLHKQKEDMEGNIAALRAELEMSYSQMRLMMLVSTEIQNEFENFKTRIDAEVKTLLNQKQAEHEAELKALEEKLSATPVGTIAATAAIATATTTAVNTDRSVDVSEADKMQQEVLQVTDALKAAEIGKSAAEADKMAAESGKLNAEKEAAAAISQVNSLRDQVVSLTEALEEKHRAVLDLESQLKTQKMTMDAQMMELTQTILEKDALLMEFMSSRNNSRDVISPSQQQPDALGRSMASATVAPVSLTNSFYHPQEDNSNSNTEARLQMSQVRQYMYSSSDDDDEDESEVIMMSYSDEEVESNVHQVYQSNNTLHHEHYHQMMNTSSQSNTLHSPAETISSTITFDSSEEDEEEEEKVAEIKHFSYSSVQSQVTRPVSLISTTGSLSNGAISDNESQHNRLSVSGPVVPARFSVTKETNANWPMPPPTPPPSEPLPPVPAVIVENKQVNNGTQQEPSSPIAKIQESILPPLPTPPTATTPVDDLKQMNSIVPPPRRARSKTMAREEVPDLSVYTTSVHQTNELPRIIPVQKPKEEQEPVPPPRKDVPTAQHTKWMDDPESEEDDLWCDTESKQPEWNAVAV
jgi:chromosome segregation ATPase